ncbi:MAG: hypothetical protein K0S08_1647 [Gammaproteobacteria bacterium]|jgi:hypothetical protein|nr:hypothetical protein [Gammaproteobacteria bacterium]
MKSSKSSISASTTTAEISKLPFGKKPLVPVLRQDYKSPQLTTHLAQAAAGLRKIKDSASKLDAAPPVQKRPQRQPAALPEIRSWRITADVVRAQRESRMHNPVLGSPTPLRGKGEKQKVAAAAAPSSALAETLIPVAVATQQASVMIKSLVPGTAEPLKQAAILPADLQQAQEALQAKLQQSQRSMQEHEAWLAEARKRIEKTQRSPSGIIRVQTLLIGAFRQLKEGRVVEEKKLAEIRTLCALLKSELEQIGQTQNIQHLVSSLTTLQAKIRQQETVWLSHPEQFNHLLLQLRELDSHIQALQLDKLVLMQTATEPSPINTYLNKDAINFLVNFKINTVVVLKKFRLENLKEAYSRDQAVDAIDLSFYLSELLQKWIFSINELQELNETLNSISADMKWIALNQKLEVECAQALSYFDELQHRLQIPEVQETDFQAVKEFLGEQNLYVEFDPGAVRENIRNEIARLNLAYEVFEKFYQLFSLSDIKPTQLIAVYEKQKLILAQAEAAVIDLQKSLIQDFDSEQISVESFGFPEVREVESEQGSSESSEDEADSTQTSLSLLADEENRGLATDALDVKTKIASAIEKAAIYPKVVRLDEQRHNLQVQLGLNFNEWEGRCQRYSSDVKHTKDSPVLPNVISCLTNLSGVLLVLYGLPDLDVSIEHLARLQAKLLEKVGSIEPQSLSLPSEDIQELEELILLIKKPIGELREEIINPPLISKVNSLEGKVDFDDCYRILESIKLVDMALLHQKTMLELQNIQRSAQDFDQARQVFNQALDVFHKLLSADECAKGEFANFFQQQLGEMAAKTQHITEGLRKSISTLENMEISTERAAQLVMHESWQEAEVLGNSISEIYERIATLELFFFSEDSPQLPEIAANHAILMGLAKQLEFYRKIAADLSEVVKYKQSAATTLAAAPSQDLPGYFAYRAFAEEEAKFFLHQADTIIKQAEKEFNEASNITILTEPPYAKLMASQPSGLFSGPKQMEQFSTETAGHRLMPEPGL